MNNCGRKVRFAALHTLVTCLLALAVSACAGEKPTREQAIERYSQELRQAVSTNVHAERRQTQMLRLVDQLEAVQRRFNQQTADFVASYRELNANYDATRPAFDQLFSGYSAKRIKARNEALELHFQLASLATVDEWKSIGKAEAKLFEEVNGAQPAKESTS